MSEKISTYEAGVIEAFELTNTEWLRYRMVDELPERATSVLTQRYIEQTAPLLDFDPFGNRRIKKLPTIDFSSVEAATSGIISHTDQSLTLPQLDENTLKDLVINLSKYKEDYSFFNLDQSTKSTLSDAAEEWIDKFQKRVQASPPKTKREEALVIATLFCMERVVPRPSKRVEIFDGMLERAFSNRDFELIGELLVQECDRLGTMVHRRLENHYDVLATRPSKERDRDAGAILLAPLVSYANSFIEGNERINDIYTNTPLILKVCDDLRGWLGSHALSRRNVDSRKLADLFFQTCINSWNNYPNQHISHDGLSGVFKILIGTYSLTEGQTQLPFNKIYTFLCSLYYKKVTIYSNDWGYLPKEHLDFVRLAELMKLDMDIIKGKKPIPQ